MTSGYVQRDEPRLCSARRRYVIHSVMPQTAHSTIASYYMLRDNPWLCTADSHVGLVVKASASRAEGPGFESRWRRDISGSSHTSDLNIGTPVATLPDGWSSRVNAGAGRPGVSIL